MLKNNKKIEPKKSLYDLSVELNNGSFLNLNSMKGRKILFVNTASDCGYTGQYEELQNLYEHNKEKLTIIGFPANDFKEQEKGTDEEIAQFCKLNYGVGFPLAKKSTVINSPGQNQIFQWLTKSELNGWCNHNPGWNFSKYLVNEKGILTHYFDSAVSPLDREVTKAILAGEPAV